MGTPAAAANYVASRELVTPRRLREFFAPKSVVMVGASDNSRVGQVHRYQLPDDGIRRAADDRAP